MTVDPIVSDLTNNENFAMYQRQGSRGTEESNLTWKISEFRMIGVTVVLEAISQNPSVRIEMST